MTLAISHISSASTIASNPKVRLYSGCPVLVFIVVLQVHGTSGMRSTHSLGFSPTFLLRILAMLLFITSACPFVWGWWTNTKLNFMLLSLQNFLICWPANWVDYTWWYPLTQIYCIFLCYIHNHFNFCQFRKIVYNHK